MLKGGCIPEGRLQDSRCSSVPVEGIYVTDKERTPKGPGNDDYRCCAFPPTLFNLSRLGRCQLCLH